MGCKSLKLIWGLALLVPRVLCEYTSDSVRPTGYFKCLNNISIRLDDTSLYRRDLQESREAFWQMVHNMRFTPYTATFHETDREDLQDAITNIAQLAECGAYSDQVFQLYELFVFLADYLRNKQAGFAPSWEIYSTSRQFQMLMKRKERRFTPQKRIVEYEKPSFWVEEVYIMPFRNLASHVRLFLMTDYFTYEKGENRLAPGAEKPFLILDELKKLFAENRQMVTEALDKNIKDSTNVVLDERVSDQVGQRGYTSEHMDEFNAKKEARLEQGEKYYQALATGNLSKAGGSSWGLNFAKPAALYTPSSSDSDSDNNFGEPIMAEHNSSSSYSDSVDNVMAKEGGRRLNLIQPVLQKVGPEYHTRPHQTLAAAASISALEAVSQGEREKTHAEKNAEKAAKKEAKRNGKKFRMTNAYIRLDENEIEKFSDYQVQELHLLRSLFDEITTPLTTKVLLQLHTAILES